jgi:hypothetical protein
MVDIASEVGLSRPNVYDYFADRDDLFDPAHTTISRQSSLSDQIVESLLYIADHGRRDPLTRYLIDPDSTSIGHIDY